MTKFTTGIKIRIYPNEEQVKKLNNHIGACRFIYNYMLGVQNDNHENGGKYISTFDMNKMLTPLKNDGEHGWLYEVSNASLQSVCKDLNAAFQNFFKKNAKYPRFKSKRTAKKNYPLRSDCFYFKDEGVVYVNKIGDLKYKTDFEVPFGKDNKFLNPRITFVNNKWILSFSIECESQAPGLTDKIMGIDLGIKSLAVVEFNGQQITYDNINKSKKMRRLEKRIKHLQRIISRKYEANKDGDKYVKTNNIIKCEKRLKKLYYRQRCIRQNYLHQTTHELVSMYPARVVMEDLNVSGMMKNKHLSKAIQEQSFYEFRRQMTYKCERNGIEIVFVDTFYPSSKTCSCCGHIKKDLKLNDRIYVCPECGLEIDRDYNAAINLSNYVVA